MKGLVFVACLFAFLAAHSQAVIDFDHRIHDFGNIKEINGSVSYDFVFTNRGTAPVLIRNVESSCGCTSPEWTKQPVLPGKTGYVRATFDPKDRPGHFDKTITVYSNAKTPVVELKIKGDVEGRTRTILDDYPYELSSGLRLPLDHFSLMKVKKGEVKKMTLGVFNNSGKKVQVSFSGLPSYLSLSMEPQVLDVKGTGSVQAAYNTALHGAYGLNEEEVVMLVDGKKYPVRVSVFIEEDFTGTDRNVAPAMQVEKKYYNFGIIGEGQSAQYVYKLKNTGKSVMKIHRFYTNDKRLAVEFGTQEIAPGQEAALTVKVVKNADKGKLQGMISVITNCPDSPETNLRFYGEIK